MAEDGSRKAGWRGFFGNINNNGIPSLNKQNKFNPEIRDWEHRKERLRDTYFK
jgi:hypothetical protein